MAGKLHSTLQASLQQQRMLRKISLWEAIGGGPANLPNYDRREDLGYGTTKSKFHAPRQYQGTYPYREPVEEIDDDEEIDSSLTTKLQNKASPGGYSGDPYATNKVNPFYFVGAATSLNAFSESVAPNRSKGSIVPIPGLYKRKQAIAGGVNSTSPVSPFKQVLNTKSTPHGYSKAPLPVDEFFDEPEDETLQKLRSVIRAYHSANLLRK